MTAAELVVALCFLVAIARLLKPLQRFLEGIFLRWFGARDPRVIDISVIREKDNKSSKE